MKRLKYLLVSVLSLLLFTGKAYAASAGISVGVSNAQVIVGNNVTVSVTISSASSLGAWDYTLNYDSSVFRLVSSDAGLHNVGYVDNGNTKSMTYRYVFSAVAKGSSNFYISASSVADFDGSFMAVTNGSAKVSTITYNEYQATLSKNNNLASLGIEGAEITPEFNADTLEYEAKVSEDTKEINITATVADSTASVSGHGTQSVSPGNNTFKIVVVAQNGSEKTYTLNVEVLDKDPIEVTIDKQKYTVVKVKDNLKAPQSFKESTVSISGFEIPAFYSEVMKITVVGLKNEKGDISLFQYKDGKYEKYIELSFGNITLMPLNISEEKEGYSKGKVKISSEEVECLEESKDSRYKIINAKNVESNEEGLYLYDKKDNTVIKYDDSLTSALEEKVQTLTYAAFALVGAMVLSFIVIISLLKKKKSKKRKNSSEIVEKKQYESKPVIHEQKQIDNNEDEVYDIFADEKKHKKKKKK